MVLLYSRRVSRRIGAGAASGLPGLHAPAAIAIGMGMGIGIGLLPPLPPVTVAPPIGAGAGVESSAGTSPAMLPLHPTAAATPKTNQSEGLNMGATSGP